MKLIKGKLNEALKKTGVCDAEFSIETPAESYHDHTNQPVETCLTGEVIVTLRYKKTGVGSYIKDVKAIVDAANKLLKDFEELE